MIRLACLYPISLHPAVDHLSVLSTIQKCDGIGFIPFFTLSINAILSSSLASKKVLLHSNNRHFKQPRGSFNANQNVYSGYQCFIT